MALSIAGGLECGGWWRPEVRCGEHLAGDRATWLVENAGQDASSAQQKVMAEFPDLFRPGVSWVPDRQCGEHLAEDRSQWLQREKGLSCEVAQARVMAEFDEAFVVTSGAPGWHFVWSSEAICDGPSAQERAAWLEANQGLTAEAAQRRVIKEFAAVFLWHPAMQCGEHVSSARVAWLTSNQNLSFPQAVDKVRGEFPTQFSPTTSAAAGAAAFSMGGKLGDVSTFEPMADADASQLVWCDDFGYEGAPDPSKWDYDEGGHGWGNHELQNYTSRRANSWVSDGTLKIRAVREDFQGAGYTSARLVTKNKGDWLGGRVEVRARLPTARGNWAAIWMLPTDWAYGQWPNSGEIDIMEHVGYDCGRVHGTVHTEKFNHMKNTQVGKTLSVDVADWHTYVVEWSETRIDFGVDGQRYHRFTDDGTGAAAWPFNKRFHILLNLAVGGDWGGQKGIDEASFQGDGQIMEVSSVRVYSRS